MVAVLFFPLLRRARRLLKKKTHESMQHVTVSIAALELFFLTHGNLAGNGSLERCAQ